MVYFSLHQPGGYDIIYNAYANEDFTDLSTIPQQLFYSPNNSSCIDADIIYVDGKYHLFHKNELGNGIYKAVSDSLNGGYVLVNKRMDQSKDRVEGSGIFKLNSSEGYILIYDLYTSGAYQFTKSNDLVNFSIVGNTSMDFSPRHGTVIQITWKEARAISNIFTK